MIKLKDTFQKAFGVQIEQLLPLEKNLIPIEGNIEDALLFGSKAAVDEPYYAPPSPEKLDKSIPEGYFLIGFWGYGSNSYAFYYSVVDSKKKVYFRLPYGGAYSNIDEDAKHVCKFLSNFMEFQKKLDEKIEKLIAMEFMGAGYYKIIKPGGNIFEIRESLFINPDFKGKFHNLLES